MRAHPTPRALSKASVDESKSLQLFLKRGGKYAESQSRAFLIASGREEDGGDQIPLELVQHVPQDQTLGARYVGTWSGVEGNGPFRVTRHGFQDRASALPKQWMGDSLPMNIGAWTIEERRGNPACPLLTKCMKCDPFWQLNAGSPGEDDSVPRSMSP